LKLTLTSTPEVAALELAPGVIIAARIWTGENEHGIAVTAYIPVVLVAKGQPAEAFEPFETELIERNDIEVARGTPPTHLVIGEAS